MASKALSCSSTLVSCNRASFGPLFKGLGPRSNLFLASSKIPSFSSMVVNVQQHGGGRMIDPLDLKSSDQHFYKKVELFDSSPYDKYSTPSTAKLSYIVRTTWNTSEDENEISMSFDMRGIHKAENIQVRVADDMLLINVDHQEGFDSDGNSIKSSCYDSQIQLPSNSRKEDITAVFKNSVLYICVPKITKSHHKLVHIPVTNVY